MAARLTQHSMRNISTDDDQITIEEFRRNLRIVIRKDTHDDFRFDVHNISPAIANTLRRIILDECPTVAIDTVVFRDNSSIIQDEVLAHRLGLVPMHIDARLFEPHVDGGDITERNTVVFKLTIEAPEATGEIGHYSRRFSSDATDSNRWFCVYSGDMQWVPIGTQAEWLHDVRSLHPDILLAKLAPGQRIDLELYCHKGIGKTHAKFQPVGTAWYSLKPRVTFDTRFFSLNKSTPKDTVRAALESIRRVCPVGVFDGVQSIKDLEDFAERFGVASDKCTLCRECIHKFSDSDENSGVWLELDKTHYRFVIESASFYSGREILEEALKIMSEKAIMLISSITSTDPDE